METAWTYDVLASNDGQDVVGLLAIDANDLVFELGMLLGTALVDLFDVLVGDGAMVNLDDIVVVLVWQSLLVRDGLNGDVEVVLMDLLLHGGEDLLVLVFGDCLMIDRLCDDQ